MGVSSWAIFKEYGPNDHIKWNLFLFKNRYCRILTYGWTMLCASTVYYGWQPLSRMFIRDGVYSWECPADWDFSQKSYCDAQYNKIQELYTAGIASEYTFSIISGILFDNIGPFLTGVLGQLTFISGWLMLIFSSESLQMYIPGMCCIAGAVNLNAYPCLVVSELFPLKSGFVLSFIIAAQTASAGVTPIMESIWNANPSWTFDGILWGYVCFIVLPTILIFLPSLPISRAAVAAANPTSTKSLENEGKVDVATAEGKAIKGGVADDGVWSPQRRGSSSQSSDSEEATPIGGELSTAATEACQEGKQSSVTDVKQLIGELLTPEWLLFALYYFLQLLQFGYYPTTVLDQSGQDIADFQGWMMPTQAVWGILFGLIVDYTKTLPICVGLVISMSLAYLLALWPNETGLQYVTTLLFVASNAYIFTVKYTYCWDVFKPDNFGMLVGLIGSLSGVICLINIPVQDANNYSATCLAYMIVGFVCLIILAYLNWYLKKRSTTRCVKQASSAEKASQGGEMTELVASPTVEKDVV